MACRLAEGYSTRTVPTNAAAAAWTTVKTRPPKSKFISTHTALRLQRELDIRGLANTLLSVESHNLQTSGWKFARVIKNDDESKSSRSGSDTWSEGEERTTLPIKDNKWGDEALFIRRMGSERNTAIEEQSV